MPARRVHVLIEGVPRPTRALFEELDPRPRIWTQNVVSHPYDNVLDHVTGKPNIARIWLADLVGQANARRDASRDLDDLIAEARADFGLQPTDKLKVALVGNHTTATDECVRSLPQGIWPDLTTEQYIAFQTELRRGRAFVQRLFEVLHARSDVLEIVWLADIRRRLRPTVLLPPDLNGISACVRTALATDGKATLGLVRHDRRPSLPFLFVRPRRNASPAPWTSASGFGGFDKPFSTHISLLEAYRDSPGSSGGHAALAMLLGPDLSAHNPLDPPIVNDQMRRLCASAGVGSILLDKRVGAIFTGSSSRRGAKVFVV